MTLTPVNDILLYSQVDSELILVHIPGNNQSVTLIPLSSPFCTPQADDTLFILSDDGFILVSDTLANIVYKIRKSRFVPGTPYTAAVGAPDSSGASVGFVGILYPNFGELVTIVTGLQSPHGMGFVRAATMKTMMAETPAISRTNQPRFVLSVPSCLPTSFRERGCNADSSK